MAAGLVRILLAGLILLSLLAGTSVPAASDDAETTNAPAPPMTTFPFLGGTVTMNPKLETGERFLTLVPPPVFTRTEEALQNPRLQPGNMGDQPEQQIIQLQRPHTTYDYMYEEWTGGMILDNIHGTPDEYVCVCDITLIMTNSSGLDPTLPLEAIKSRYLWFDNVTLYGGAIAAHITHDVIVSNSLFIDSSGVVGEWAERGYVHNITSIIQRGPTNILNHPPDPLGRDFMCFPHNVPPCERGGVTLFAGGDWIVEWSHFHGAGGVSSTISSDVTVRHNTFRDTLAQWAGGHNEVSWNLFRGNTGAGPHAFGNDYTHVHNNSIVLVFKLSHGTGIDKEAGLEFLACAECDVKHNDIIGWGHPNPINSECCAALRVRGPSHVLADDNYWGTIHDPKIPAGWWIDVGPGSTVILDRWEIEPIHSITPIAYTLDTRDIPWYVEQITGIPLYEDWEHPDLPYP